MEQPSAAGAARPGPARLWFAASLPSAGIAAAAPFASVGWLPDLCLHLSLLAIVSLLPGMIAVRRDPRRGGVLLVALLCGAWPWLASAHAQRAPLGRDGLAVVTANLYDFNPRRDQALAAVRDLDAGLLAVQEVWPGDEAVLAPRWPHRVWHRGDGLFASALLSRHPLRETRIHDLSGFALIEAVVEAPDGALRVFVVHLASPKRPERAAVRAAQLARLAEMIAATEGPLLVLGDFNLSAAAPAWRAFCSRTGLLAPAGGNPATWPRWLGPLGIDLDHVVGRAVILAPLDTVIIPGSDHRALRSRVALR